MYPHERSLVEKMKNEPFALIGVNSDDRETAQQAIVDNELTWRSFWDGGNTSGPIATAYQVRGWPTIYVLDHNGVIRHKNVRGQQLDSAIETLVEEAEAAGPVPFAVNDRPTAESADLRQYTDNTGRYKTIATFVEFKGGKARLRREDGKVVAVQMTRMSKEDQEYIRDILRQRRAARKADAGDAAGRANE